jgi:IS5 family transposase
VKREEGGVSRTLFRFVKQVASLAQKCSAAGLMKVSNPIGCGFAAWKHVVLHYLRIHEEKSYAGVVDLASEMDRVRALLNLGRWDFPSPSALYRSFNRAPMSLWRGLLNRSTQLLDRSGHAAIDSTFFERNQASTHYLRRIDRSVETLKITFLIDTADQAILDVHCSAKWPNDAVVGPKLTSRNSYNMVSLAADKGYDSTAFRDQLRENGVRPLIKHRIYKPIDHAHNARMDADRYNQRSLTETVNSVIKRSILDSVHSRTWFRQFREIILAATVHNIKRSITPETRFSTGIQ